MRIYNALGLMSGSSLDGMDLALCHFNMKNGEVVHWELKQAGTLPFSREWQVRLCGIPRLTRFVLAT